MAKQHDSKSSQAIIIFGGTGDLTWRKLIPSLLALFKKGKIDKHTPIIGIARKNYTRQQYHTFLKITNEKTFKKNVYYHSLDFMSEKTDGLTECIKNIEKKHRTKGNRLFYLAINSLLFNHVSDTIHDSGLLDTKGWTRVVFEKPFGQDLQSAKEINHHVTSIFSEKEIYRIDHYLGKELTQNILATRFANSLFEHLMSKRFVDHIQISVLETLGVEERAEYYDKTGAIRDMVQNHIVQLIALISMNEPKAFTAKDVRDEKVRILKSLRKVKPENLVIGQYDKGKKMKSYRQEKGVPKNSRTETFIALKTFVDTARWRGVPFYVRTGKRTGKHIAEVTIVLKDKPCDTFCDTSMRESANILSIQLQPNAGIAVRVNVKKPESHTDILPITMNFCYSCKFTNTSEAYEVLFQEIIAGDQTLFTRWDGVCASWKFVGHVMKHANKKRRSFPNYTSGSMGPNASDTLLKRDGKEWILVDAGTIL